MREREQEDIAWIVPEVLKVWFETDIPVPAQVRLQTIALYSFYSASCSKHYEDGSHGT